MGLFDSLKKSLEKSRQNLAETLSNLVSGSASLNDEFFDELEEALILADVSAAVASRLVDSTRKAARKMNIQQTTDIYPVLQAEVVKLLQGESESTVPAGTPHVILVVGVNGSGKTTSIGKLSHYYRQQGKRVVLAAADTFRAAAGEQLNLWAQRTGAEIIIHADGSDPAAVVFDALSAAKARKADVLIIDTAGRLHTKTNLMEELKKIRRIIEREVVGAPHETLLVLDAVTGQNALHQARIFHEATTLTGVVLTKLEGTAKGGFVISIRTEFGVPVRWIGLGEKPEDLEPFDAEMYARALLSEN